MAVSAGLLANAYRRIVAMNPRQITVDFRRRVQDPDTGGWQDDHLTLGPFSGLVERRRSGLSRLVVDTSGARESGFDYVLVALPDAAIPAGNYSTTEAVFTVPTLGRFRIADVWPGEAEGVVCGYVCALEQVGP